MNFHLVEENRDQFSVTHMCKTLGISKSGYYAWKSRPVSQREQENQVLALHIKAIHRETDQTYGTPRITEELNEAGIVCSASRIARIKQKMGLKAIGTPRKFRCTTKAASNAIVSPDLLSRAFNADEVNQKWVSDISYIPIVGGHAYLCVVMDLFSRKIVGWSLRASLTAELAVEAFKKARATRKPPRELIFHSDRGSQYTSEAFQNTVAENGIRSSMGRKGDCFDNAVAESFFSTLKIERVHRDTYATVEQARRRISNYIRFYNTRRRHSTLGYKSPQIYEQLLAA